MNTLLKNQKIYMYYKEITNIEKKYVCLNQKQFSRLMNSSIVYIETEYDQIIGLFIVKFDQDNYYITLLYGNNETKRTLVDRHMKRFPNRDLWLHFLNPDCLAWYPKKDVVHPCLQGAILNSNDYLFYISHHFEVQSLQETYYMDLNNYHITENINELIQQQHSENGITFNFYNKLQYESLLAFFDELQIPSFKKTVLSHILKNKPLPLLIVSDHDKIIGFTGPLKVEPSKRGYFAGIAILPSYQGKKLGKILFNELCKNLKIMNAEYMTLFTNMNNTAKYIYLSTGFEVIETCATLKRNGE